MRARLVDPQGPLWTRIAALLGPWLVLGLGASTGLIPDRSMALIGALLFLLSVLFWRRRSREVEIALGPGFVEIKRARLLNQRIRSRGLTGASTAFLAEGIGLVLQHRGRPIALEIREDRDADAVRDALGIGHHGFGMLAWRIAARRMATPGRWVCFGSAILCGLGAIVGDLAIIPSFLMVAAMVWAVPVIGITVLTMGSWMSRSDLSMPVGIELAPDALILREPRQEVPYGAIFEARVTEYGIVVLTEPQNNPQLIHVRTGAHMTADERAHCVAQIIAAARRARGLGPREPLVSGYVQDLTRGAADARGWLLRLDAAAQQMANGAGYRGVAVDTTELWAALEDHEADEHVRAAAARVLVRTDKQSKKRIQTIAESTRDKITERRIRVVLEPDIDEASREIDALDQRRRMTLDSPGATQRG